jgi:hypothetical protein
MRGLAAFCVAAVAVASAVFSQQSQSKRRITGEDAGHLESRSCEPCHRAIYQSYRRTGQIFEQAKAEYAGLR